METKTTTDYSKMNAECEAALKDLAAALKAEAKRISSNNDYLSNRQLYDLVHQMENLVKDAKKF